jgi:carbon-monoxide dehydrogenase large subunit
MATQELSPKLVGARVRRVEDPRFLLGRAEYVDDMARPGLVQAAFVRSPHAHARLRSVDLGPALALPGVVGGLTGTEVLAATELIRADSTTGEWQNSTQPALAAERVLYAGEPVAVVVAADRYTAEDAAEQVVVDYELLPVVADVETAMREGAPLLHAGWTNNAFVKRNLDVGDVDAAFAAADGVVRLRCVTHRHAAVRMQ